MVIVVGGAHITFDGVSVTFAGKPALIDVDLVVPRHQIFGIIGPVTSASAPPFSRSSSSRSSASHVYCHLLLE
jgi:hypothetical protein